MRIIARKTLKDFAESLQGSKDHKAVKAALDAWFHEVQPADWQGPGDVIRSYANASIVGNDRVVFNIKGNTYRVVVAVKYDFHAVYVRFIGTHAEYDRIDATTI